MKSEELKKLYDAVSAKYDIGDYKTFLTRMQTVDGRKKFHAKVSEVFNIGTFEDMEKRLRSSGCSAGGKKNKAGKCIFPCLKKLDKFKVEGGYRMGGGIYTFYTSGNYKFVGDDPKNSKNGTWTCNTNGFTEIDGQKPSFIPQFEWVVAPTEEEVKTGKRLLKSGMRGDFVTKVQQQLKVKGVDPKGVDGKFGKNTKNAVIKFQETVELNNDGVVGPKTYQELFFEVPKVEPTNVQNQEPTQQPVEQPGLNPVYEPKAPEIQRQQPTVPPLTNREQRKANRMTPKQQNAHVDPKPTIKESLKVTLVEKKQEKENLLIESKIISNRFNILSEGLEITTNEQKIKFVDTISEELNYLTTQGYSSKVINEGLFSFLGSLFGGSVKSVPAVFGEYIAQWLTKKLGIPEGSFMQSSIVALVGNLNISDYDKFFTDCGFASNKIADSLIEGYLIQMQQRAQATSQGATGFITSAMRNAISEYFLEDKEGIVQKLQDMIGDFLCPKLSKVASTLQDKAEDIKDKAVA